MLLTLDVTALSRVERLALAHMMSEHLGARVPTLGTALAEAVTAAADAGADAVRVDLEWPDPDRPVEEAVRELEAAAWWLHRAIRLAPQYKTLAPLNGPKWTPMSRPVFRTPETSRPVVFASSFSPR